MRIGMVHPALGVEDLRAIFARAAKAGAEGVEICYPSPGTATALGQEDHAKDLAKRSKSSGVGICSLHLGCFRGEPALIGRPAIIERAQQLVRRALATAAEAGAAMVAVPFFGKNAIELEEELDRAADALMELVDSAEQAGVILGVESTLNFHQMQFLLNRLGDTGDVRIYYNTGAALSRKLDVATGIRDLGPGVIAQVRFSDVRIAEGQPPDFSVPLGEGNVDFGATAQALRAVGYDGWIVAHPPPIEEATSRKTLAAAKAAVEFARTVLEDAAGE